MARLGPYEVHPFADEFPLIGGDEFNDLVQSIKNNGLRQPIVLSHDKRVLIDGRNRYRACEAAGVDPTFKVLPSDYTEPMILDLIVDANVERRQLNAGQKGGIGLSYERRYAAAIRDQDTRRKSEAGGPAAAVARNQTNGNATKPDPAKSRPESSGSSSAKGAAGRAAQATGASATSVKQMKALQRDAPDLYAAVMAGRISVDAADRQRRQRLAAQPKPERVPGPTATMLTLLTHKGDPVLYPEPQSRATFNQTSGPGISWAQWSWNPVTGCLHGCNYCYAREIATNKRFENAYPAGFTPLFHHERLDAPANTVLPLAHRDEKVPCEKFGCPYKRVFVCSMADLYGRWVPDEWIQQVHKSMLATPEWQYILLTKFPARYVGLDLPSGAWVGTSVDEQKRVRIAEDAFRKIDGVKVRWLSLEPLLEPLEFTDLSVFDWVVIGAQTETRQPSGTVDAFSPPAEWVVRITKQAMDSGCKVHWKPNLRTDPGMRWLDEYPEVT